MCFFTHIHTFYGNQSLNQLARVPLVKHSLWPVPKLITNNDTLRVVSIVCFGKKLTFLMKYNSSLRVTVHYWKKKLRMHLTSAHLFSLARRRGSHHDSHTYLCNPTEKGDWLSYKAGASSTEFSVLLGYCCEIAQKRGGFLAFLNNYYFVSDPALPPNVRGLVSPTIVWPFTLQSWWINWYVREILSLI